MNPSSHSHRKSKISLIWRWRCALTISRDTSWLIMEDMEWIHCHAPTKLSRGGTASDAPFMVFCFLADSIPTQVDYISVQEPEGIPAHSSRTPPTSRTLRLILNQVFPLPETRPLIDFVPKLILLQSLLPCHCEQSIAVLVARVGYFLPGVKFDPGTHERGLLPGSEVS